MNQVIRIMAFSICFCSVWCRAASNADRVSAITTNYRQAAAAGASISQTFPASVRGIVPITSDLVDAHMNRLAAVSMGGQSVLVFGTPDSLFYLPINNLESISVLPVRRLEPRSPLKTRKRGINAADIAGNGLSALKGYIADKDYAAAYARDAA